jgi:predicted nuclease with TOPRIM domain
MLDAVSSVTDSKVVREGLTTIQSLRTKVEAGIKTVQELKAAVDECRQAKLPSIEQLQQEFGAQINTVEEVEAFIDKVRERYQQMGQEIGKCEQMWQSVQKLAG